MNHVCAYNSKGIVTLESLADALCHLSAELSSCKLFLRKTDKNMESFLKTELMKKSETENVNPSKSSSTHILNEFPITNLDALKTVERKLKKDKTFYSTMVEALHLEIKGESLQKTINSMLRIVLHDKLASIFNWKGQRGTKMKLSKRRIAKLMIAVTKEFPTINETIFGRKAGAWLAQATFRARKHSNINDEACPDDNDYSSSESLISVNNDEDSEDEK
ncbi:PREDICTED: uncharacterized protein LOC105451265 isoform X2 [Wasmannia auropunctata]|uniref:uncharacterized protein LOC105451265 isoform X2 n=1 Tax=Wasmannia auropunctata TaxID=64793 RepID=UPI0005EEB262|nr:PREDICTED: uncharacterized protein LOC105451265 isoform X2 [Wasmannia auropunctata]